MNTPQWYCIRTKPLRELPIARYLQEVLGLETFFPRLKREKTIRRVRRIMTGPLFPRYLFCRFVPAQHFRAVRYAQEVTEIVSRGDQPTPVDDGLIHELKAWAEEAVDMITVKPGLLPGDAVAISGGLMRGLHGVFLHEMNDRDRVAILLSTLGGDARIIVNRCEVDRIA
jgi:transcriptional antiterminator RfaH